MKAEIAAIGSFAACVYGGKMIGDRVGSPVIGAIGGGVLGLFVANAVGSYLSEPKEIEPAPNVINTEKAEEKIAVAKASGARIAANVSKGIRTINSIGVPIAPYLRIEPVNTTSTGGGAVNTDDAVRRA